jgi:hypothetical protein
MLTLQEGMKGLRQTNENRRQHYNVPVVKVPK